MRDLASCRAPSCRKLHASTVRKVSGITSAAEKERAERHVLGGRARKIHMMHRADHAARGVEQDVEIDHRQCDAFGTTPSSTKIQATMIVVNSSRKSSTHRCTTQNRQKSVVVKCDSGRASKPTA